MKEYFVSVIALSLVGRVLVTLAPSGGFSKSIRLLCALCTVACIAFPIGAFVYGEMSEDDIKNAFDTHLEGDQKYDEFYNYSVSSYSVLEAELILKNEISQRFGVSNESFDLEIVRSEENGINYISLVRVHLYSSGVAVDPRRIEAYVLERLDCACEFVYDVF